MAAIRDAIAGVVESDPPMTVRQVFYQLVSRGVIEKTEDDRLLTDVRLDGSNSFDDIVDEMRRVWITQTFDDLQAAVDHTARFYRRPALKLAPDYIEIRLEKDALAGVLWDVTSDFDVPLMASRGMP